MDITTIIKEVAVMQHKLKLQIINLPIDSKQFAKLLNLKVNTPYLKKNRLLEMCSMM